MTRTLRATFTTLALWAGSVGACPGIETGGIATRCERLGDKCKLPSGPLGVCDRGACKDGSQGGCLQCVPQH